MIDAPCPQAAEAGSGPTAAVDVGAAGPVARRRRRRHRPEQATAQILPWPVRRPPPVLGGDSWLFDLRSAVLMMYHYQTIDPWPPYAEHIRRQLHLALAQRSVGVELSRVFSQIEEIDLLQTTLALNRDFDAQEW